MMATITKAKAIDQFLSESPVAQLKKDKVGLVDSGGISSSYDDVGIENDEEKQRQKEMDEMALYGYGDAAPTPKMNINAGTAASAAAPRRSSLSTGKDGEKRRAARRASLSYSGEMTLVLPTGETRKKRTSISFADSTDVKEVEPVADMVDGDRKKLWFQSSEYEGIQEKIYESIQVAKKSHKDKTERPTWVCLRGLEAVLDRSIFESRKEATGAIIEEQKALKKQGRFDQEYLRDMYMFHSVDAQVRAEERAESDAKEIKEYLKVTRRMCRRMSC